MIVRRLELVDFRNYHTASFELHPGTTAVVGLNGQGKTNLAEALAYLATLDSFRGAPNEALIRSGADTAIVRATVLHDDGREVLVELELSRLGRNRAQVNRQRLGRARDLLGVMRVTVFSPDDLTLIKGGPHERRAFLDTTLVALAVKYDALRLELDRIVRQRNTLLKQAGGRLTAEIELTLDVWDAKLTEAGEQLGHARAVLVERLGPSVRSAYSVFLLALILLMSAVGPLLRHVPPAPGQPQWFALALVFVNPLAALTGGLLTRRVDAHRRAAGAS